MFFCTVFRQNNILFLTVSSSKRKAFVSAVTKFDIILFQDDISWQNKYAGSFIKLIWFQCNSHYVTNSWWLFLLLFSNFMHVTSSIFFHSLICQLMFIKKYCTEQYDILSYNLPWNFRFQKTNFILYVNRRKKKIQYLEIPLNQKFTINYIPAVALFVV